MSERWEDELCLLKGDYPIENIDLSNHVIASAYKVYKKAEYDEWIDGNRVKHRNLVRYRTSGEMTLFFKDLDEYEEFPLKSNMVERLTVKDNLSNALVTGSFFVEFEPVRYKNALNQTVYNTFVMKIEEI